MIGMYVRNLVASPAESVVRPAARKYVFSKMRCMLCMQLCSASPFQCRRLPAVVIAGALMEIWTA